MEQPDHRCGSPPSSILDRCRRNSRSECTKRYLTKDGTPCSTANIWKVYTTYAPRLYAEKDVSFVPLGQRDNKDAATARHKEWRYVRAVGSRGKMSRVDVELGQAFATLPHPPSSEEGTRMSDATANPCQHRLPSNKDPGMISPSENEPQVTFLCRHGNVSYNHSPSLTIPLSSLREQSTPFRTTLSSSSHIRTIHHSPKVTAATLSRFNACIDPTLISHLPSHVTTPYGVFEQSWIFNELQELYVLAVILGAWAVFILVFDRWTDELRRPEPRKLVNEWKEVVEFDGLGDGPELLSFALQNYERGFDFFASVSLSTGKEGREKMLTVGLGYCSEVTKKGLSRLIDRRRWVDLRTADADAVCAVFHSSGHNCHVEPVKLRHRQLAASSYQPPKSRTCRSRAPFDAKPDSDSSDSDKPRPNTVFNLLIPD